MEIRRYYGKKSDNSSLLICKADKGQYYIEQTDKDCFLVEKGFVKTENAKNKIEKFQRFGNVRAEICIE